MFNYKRVAAQVCAKTEVHKKRKKKIALTYNAYCKVQ